MGSGAAPARSGRHPIAQSALPHYAHFIVSMTLDALATKGVVVSDETREPENVRPEDEVEPENVRPEAEAIPENVRSE